MKNRHKTALKFNEAALFISVIP